MLPSVLSAALSLSMMLTAAPAPHRTVAPKGQYVTVSNGVTTKRVFKPSIHHFVAHKNAAPSSSPSSSSASRAAAPPSGCYEMNSNSTLVPCAAPR